MVRNVLVVAAHSDDEALGVGGTIARHVKQGHNVKIAFLTDGVSSRHSTSASDSEVEGREQASLLACKALGVSNVVAFNFPDNQMDDIPLLDITKAIETLSAEFKPNIVYTHHAGDLNVDHRCCHQAVLTAFRPMPGQTVQEIYGFEVMSSTEWAFGSASPAFVPNHFVNIADTLEKKMEALAHYEEEMRPFPHARSYPAVRALATWRGATVGCPAAEAFATIRTVQI